MKKKILVVYTGGTICTSIKNGKMDTDSHSAKAIIELYKKSDSPYKEFVDFKTGKMFNILSENMTVEKWNEIIGYFLDIIPTLSSYSGIIVAHGTDTLAYSAALFSILLKGISIPVFFVSSNYSILCESGIPNSKANGIDNFCAAVECICMNVEPGVYATYKNPEDGRMYLHKGAHLTQCRIYDENFYSYDALDITDLSYSSLKTVKEYTAPDISVLPLKWFESKKLTDCVLKVTPYVGLNYDMFSLKKVKAVLHGTYHSGTACVVKSADNPGYIPDAGSILYFFEKCAKANIPFYLSPAKTGEEQTVYASVLYIERHVSNGHRVNFCFGQTDELMYAKLLTAYSLDMHSSEIDSLLNNTQ